MRLLKLNNDVIFYFSYEERYALATLMNKLAKQKINHSVTPSSKSEELTVKAENIKAPLTEIEEVLRQLGYCLPTEIMTGFGLSKTLTMSPSVQQKEVYAKLVPSSEQKEYQRIVNASNGGEFSTFSHSTCFSEEDRRKRDGYKPVFNSNLTRGSLLISSTGNNNEEDLLLEGKSPQSSPPCCRCC